MIVVFVGPTVPREQVASIVRAEIRPPAARGDVLRAAKLRPDAIGIVDGYFDGSPSVWHKEILWAMEQGIHVFGAASMGALRAAELHAFGMVGVGDVFDAFATGLLEDDDEVAVTHASSEHGYRQTSEAMVNIRATLRAALGAGIVSPETAEALVRLAKAHDYPERRYEAVLRSAIDAGLSSSELERLKGWLPGHRVDQKHADGVAMFRRLAEEDARGWEPKRVEYRLERTDAWATLDQWSSAHGPEGPAAQATADLLDEVLVEGDADGAMGAGLARFAALRLAEALDIRLDGTAVGAVADEFRRERGLITAEQFTNWLRAHGIADEEVDAFFVREATVRAVFGEEAGGAAAPHVVDALRVRGAYERIARRARIKRESRETRFAEATRGTEK